MPPERLSAGVWSTALSSWRLATSPEWRKTHFKGDFMLVTVSGKQNEDRKAGNRQKELQEIIKKRANYSLAILGMSFVRNGSGRFLNLRTAQLPRTAP